MATGLKIYNTAGLLTLDMTSAISQMTGFVDTNSAVNGSLVIPAAPAGKTLFYSIVELQAQNKGLGKRPGVTLNGTTLSWQYSYQGGWGFYSMNCRIHYGYY